MPMHNLRHQIKCGRMEKRTGAAISNVGRCHLPKIVPPAPVYHEYALAKDLLDRNQSQPDPAFTKLPKLPSAPVAERPSRARRAARRVIKTADNGQPKSMDDRRPDRASVNQEKSAEPPRHLTTDQANQYHALQNQYYLPKPPSGWKQTKTSGTSGYGKLVPIPKAPGMKLGPQKAIKSSRIPVLVRDSNASPQKATKPSRIPVLVRDGKTRFNNPPKHGSAATKAVARITPTRSANGLGLGVASGDTNLPVNKGKNQNTRRCGSSHKSEHNAEVSPSCDAGSADPWDKELMDETRRKRIEKYTKIFDELVRATAEAIAKEKQEELDKKRAMKAVEEEYFDKTTIPSTVF